MEDVFVADGVVDFDDVAVGILQEMQEGKTVVFNRELTLEFGDDLVQLFEGELVEFKMQDKEEIGTVVAPIGFTGDQDGDVLIRIQRR